MREPDQTQFQQIPLVTDWRVTDNVAQLREIMREHEMGYFLSSSVFWEECLSDTRLGAVIDTRIGGLLSADLHFQPAEEGKRKAQKLANLLGGHDQTEDDGLWLRMMDPDAAYELLKWKIGLGVAYGPITWDTRDGQWIPRVTPWHPRFLRFDWSRWQFAVCTWGQPIVWLPKTDEDARSDGKWFFWGGYRSWMTGLVRSLGMAYIDRCWTERDWARYCEKYGLNIIEGKVPGGASEDDKRNFHSALANLGNEPTITTPQGINKDDASFGLDIHECTAQGWQTFKSRKEALDTDIAVRVLGQNLTTEVKGGSLAASKVHEGIRGDVKRRDAHFYKAAREQMLCWWAFYNFGDPDLAPYPRPEINASLDPVDEATQLLTIMQAMQIAPVEVDSASILEAHGVPTLEGAELDKKKAEKAAMTPPALPGTPTGQKLLGPVKPATVSDETANNMAKAITGEGDDGAPEKLNIVALKAPTSVVKRRQFYSAARMTTARKMAAAALEPELESLLALIRKASSLDEIHQHILAEAKKPGASVHTLAKLTERLNVLAGLEGRHDALVGALK